MPDDLLTKRRAPVILPAEERLRECLVYFLASGRLWWLERPREHFADARAWNTWNAQNAWMAAGCMAPSGYLVVRIGRMYYAHRLAWKLFTGEEPPLIIDHVDGDRTNNAWDNLRAATLAEQQWNKGLLKNNTSGFRGVSRHREKWAGEITIKGERIRRIFDTPEEAFTWREAKASEFHGEFYRKSKRELNAAARRSFGVD